MINNIETTIDKKDFKPINNTAKKCNNIKISLSECKQPFNFNKTNHSISKRSFDDSKIKILNLGDFYIKESNNFKINKSIIKNVNLSNMSSVNLKKIQFNSSNSIICLVCPNIIKYSKYQNIRSKISKII